MATNPFGVQNPEHVDADYIARNFVDMFTDFPRLKDKANTFINGARGAGKSMLLRSLEPEVMLKKGDIQSLAELPYFAVHVPLRKAEFAVPELSRLAGYAGIALGEHLLVMQVTFRIAEALKTVASHLAVNAASGLAKAIHRLMMLSGAAALDAPTLSASPLDWVQRTCETEIVRVRQYFTRLPFSPDRIPYEGALTGFLDFLVPVAREIQQMGGLPNVPLFVMLDDADNLPVEMQRVLNSWVSTRSTKEICLKVSTQLGYATRRTVDNRVIESPHDFAEVSLAAVYSTSDDVYFKRVRQIISRRLDLAGIDMPVEEFFPNDAEQEAELAQIAQELAIEHSKRGVERPGTGAARVRDDISRYAVPRLMRRLAGASRSSHTFSYAGFKSLVDLSSGVVRWFLEPASRMYDRVESTGATPVMSVPVKVQDEVVLEWSREFVQRLSATKASAPTDDVESTAQSSLHAMGHETELYESLRNLIESMGRLFRQRLLDETASEQRVISVVLRNKPSPKLQSVLDLGVRLGYLQLADNAAKEASGGRRPRYILARRLGPYYRLDVSGYAAHLSVTASQLELALSSPQSFVKERLRERESDQSQLTLELDASDE